MHLDRRLIALSLNVLLLHLAWTGSRGACAPMAEHAGHVGSIAAGSHGAMASMPTAPVDTERHDCSGEMLGAGCQLMTGCAALSLMMPPTEFSTIRADADRVPRAEFVGAALAVAQPLPPPPRA